MISEMFRRTRWKILLISAISVVSGVLNMGVLAFINQATRLKEIHSSDVAQFAGVLIVSILVSLLSQILLVRLSARTFHDLRERLVRGISNLSIRQLDQVGSHRLYTALTRDIPNINQLITVLPQYIYDFTITLTGLVYLAFVSLDLFFVFFVFLVVAVGVAKFVINDRAVARFKHRRSVEDELFQDYETAIGGSKELKFNGERDIKFLRDRFQPHSEAYRNATISAEVLWSLSQNWATAVVFLGLGTLLFFSINYGFSGRESLFTFIVVVLYMVGPLSILMNSFRTIYAAKIGLDRLKTLELDATPRVLRNGMPAEIFESIKLVSLSFAYPETSDGHDGFRVGPLDLKISRGEIVFFTGGNGSGKSTAAKLLTGLYEADSGVILFNGCPMDDRDRYFQTFSTIFQDYYLFESIVPRDGRPVDAREVEAMIEKLDLVDKVDFREGRFSTVKLSHGQQKRLALIVARCDDSDVYVFDEWASDQDQTFREFFYCKFLFELKRRSKTVIVVSHDDGYFHVADRIVKFDQGRIVSNVIPPDNEDQRILRTDVGIS